MARVTIYKCPECSATYKYRGAMETHYKKHHALPVPATTNTEKENPVTKERESTGNASVDNFLGLVEQGRLDKFLAPIYEVVWQRGQELMEENGGQNPFFKGVVTSDADGNVNMAPGPAPVLPSTPACPQPGMHAVTVGKCAFCNNEGGLSSPAPVKKAAGKKVPGKRYSIDPHVTIEDGRVIEKAKWVGKTVQIHGLDWRITGVGRKAVKLTSVNEKDAGGNPLVTFVKHSVVGI